MRRSNLIVIPLVAIIMLLAGYFLGSATPHQVEVTTITVTWKAPTSVIDGLGRRLVFNETPSRVVSLAPSITEMLFALGLGDRVVGVTSYCNYPPDVPRLVNEGKIAVIGGFWNPDLEKIISLRPDLVVGDARTRPHVGLKDKLESLGIKIIYIYGSGRDVTDLYRDVTTLAKVFGVEDKAVEVINSIQGNVDYVSRRLQEVNASRPKVLVLLGPPSWGLYSAGGDTHINWVITAAGGINIARELAGWPVLNYEYILKHDPDVIIVSAMGMKYEDVVNDIKGTLLAETKAFKEGRVYILDKEADDLLTRFGPRAGRAVYLIAKILHPEVFGQPDVQVVYRVPVSTNLTQTTVSLGEFSPWLTSSINLS